MELLSMHILEPLVRLERTSPEYKTGVINPYTIEANGLNSYYVYILSPDLPLKEGR